MTMVGEKRSANAVGGKTARACDSCLRRRARWYCAADDAFLCQGCDNSVHSANPLARRHERVRLKTASSSSSSSSPLYSFKPASAAADAAAPSWHQGFKRKARTPRPHHSAKAAAPHQAVAQVAAKTEPLVPDFEATSLDENAEEEEEQLLYRVPIFDPVLAEFCSGHASDDSAATTSSEAGLTTTAGEVNPPVELPKYASSPVAFANALPGFSPSDVDIGDFAADVESLLGRGLDEDAFCMEGLGLMETGGDVAECCFRGGGHVKLETSDGDDHKGINDLLAARMAANGKTLDLNFDYGSPATGGHLDEEETKAGAPAGTAAGTGMFGEAATAAPSGGLAKRRRVTLRLNYEAVIDAWSSTQGCSSPWADGERPHVNPDDCWPDYTAMWGEAPGTVYAGGGGAGGEVGGGGGDGGPGGGGTHGAAGDGGREARVSRYREKRRTRLFSKKIRYEVRKLNAEKRPRMKGRFVKSASFVGATVGVGMPVAVPTPPTYAF
ncbi:hypothetical protein Taro_019287 [Colocasia esculenta]|uniref:Uncharacterized protein n=1 Tax=Colocasia esculenta TaxID=4460 RepID=A0A843UYR1_COLES|nr:hypothetical protein [Colocasia esculenta]